MKPYYIKTEVCSSCGGPWDIHLRYAGFKSNGRRKAVKLKHCIRYLKNEFRGPTGPIGATGAQGPQGPTGIRGLNFNEF